MYDDRLSYEGREKRALVEPDSELPGEDLGRIIALTDGVFAFALTLLVLTLTVPAIDTAGLSPSQVSGNLGAALWGDWPKFVGYAFTFVMITLWWMAHHRTFRYIHRYDFVLMWMNTIVLLEIAVMPFVLGVYIAYSETQVAVVMFSVFQICTGLTINGLWRYASRGHRLIDPKLPEAVCSYFSNRGLITPLAFAGSIAISFVSVEGAEFFWFVPLVLTRLTRRYGPA